MNNNPLVKVTPVRWIEHRNFSDLVAIRGQPNFYVNLKSGKITYKRGPIKIATGHRNIMAAREFVDVYLQSKNTGHSEEQVKRQRAGIVSPLIEVIFEELMEVKRGDRMDSTIEAYFVTWNNSIGPFWADKTVAEITTHSIDAYRAWYLKNRGDKIFDKAFIHLKMLFTFALEREYIKSLPSNLDRLSELIDTVKAKTKYKKAGRVASKEEIASLIEATKTLEIKSKAQGIRSRLSIYLGYTMGLRKMEACTLLWDKVDLATGFIEVWSKNKHWRRVPMSKEVREALTEQRLITGKDEYVFAAPRSGGHIVSQVLDHVWIETKKLAGLTDRLRFHDLRHTFATMTAEENWPPVIACRVLDMSLKVYQTVYCKPSDTAIAEYFK